MHYFNYKKNILYAEDVPLKEIVDKFSTPLYIYSKKTIREHFLKLKKAFSPVKPLICYSVKANSNLHLLKLLVKEGAGLDIVSAGELYRAKKAGCPGSKIVYASVGKRPEEIKEAIKYKIAFFNVESAQELEEINRIAESLRKTQRVCLRINPDVDPLTHNYITTGKKETKFGISIPEAENIFLNRKSYPYVELCGVHLHIGSQITASSPFVKAIKKIRKFIKILKAKNIEIKYLNIGGGLGIVYDKEKPQTAASFAKRILPLVSDLGIKLIIEPGRFIAGNAGILAGKVLYTKDTPGKRFIITDCAMNDLLRPSLYGAYHKIIPFIKKRNQKKRKSDLVGPVCETGDFLAKNRALGLEKGDYFAVLGAGAYGFSMASNYNSRPRPAEVLVDNDKFYLIRRRETYSDLIRQELI